MVQSLARLIEEITVDAYDTDEQMSGFLQRADAVGSFSGPMRANLVTMLGVPHPSGANGHRARLYAERRADLARAVLTWSA